MTKLTNAEKDKLDNTCGNLRVTKLGTHVKSLEDFVNQGVLATRANDVTAAINELYGMIVNNDCATIQIPPPGFFTLFGNDEDGKLYVYYNNEDNPPVFRHVETPGELEGTLYLYIADPEGENHYEMEIGHYIAVRHLDDYYTKTQSNSRFGVTVEKQSTATSGYAATYIVKQNGSQVGTKIDIPKDFFLKGGSVKTCSTANVPVQGYVVGDKYLDMEINVDDGSATTKHMYILVKDLGQVYTADESTLTLSNDNVFSVKNGGITMTKLATDVQNTINGKENASNKVTSLSASSTDAQYPSAKCVYDLAMGGASVDMVGTFSDFISLISNASAGDVIVLDQDYKNTDSISSITLNKNLTIVGNGHRLDGDGKSCTFTVSDTVTLVDMAICNLNVSSGSIFTFTSNGVLYGGGLVFENNKTTGGNCIIYNQYGVLDLVDCSFFKNKASLYLIYNASSMSLKQCEFYKNSGYGVDADSGVLQYTIVEDCTFNGTSCQVTPTYSYSGKEDASNKVTSLNASSTDDQYPSAKLLFDKLALKQDVSSAFSGNYNDLTNKPSIPSASDSSPRFDLTSASAGNSNNYSRADHVHPLSPHYALQNHTHDNYAPNSHNHISNNIVDIHPIPVTITYLNNSTEVLNLLVQELLMSNPLTSFTLVVPNELLNKNLNLVSLSAQDLVDDGEYLNSLSIDDMNSFYDLSMNDINSAMVIAEIPLEIHSETGANLNGYNLLSTNNLAIKDNIQILFISDDNTGDVYKITYSATDNTHLVATVTTNTIE